MIPRATSGSSATSRPWPLPPVLRMPPRSCSTSAPTRFPAACPRPARRGWSSRTTICNTLCHGTGLRCALPVSTSPCGSAVAGAATATGRRIRASVPLNLQTEVPVRYISTRGEAPVLEFEGVLLAGLARDGGLYVPEEWPELTEDVIEGFAGRPYGEVAFAVMKPFVAGAIADRDLEVMIGQAYAGFGHPAVAPLRQLDADHWLLELFHGPTLAFKDVAMQVLARVLAPVLRPRG